MHTNLESRVKTLKCSCCQQRFSCSGELPFSLRPARRASHHEALGLCHTALPLAAMELRMQALAAENLKFQKQLAKYKPENQEQISRKNSRVNSVVLLSFGCV